MGAVGNAGYLLGLDAGGTFTKAVLFDAEGRQVGAGRSEIRVSSPRATWAERDMDEIWLASAAAIRQALAQAGTDGSAVAGIGVAGHNDGAYLVDAAHRPVRPGIMATDSRARDHAQRLSSAELGQRALSETGQLPAPYSPSAILCWLREHEPESLDRATALLFCKDWLRLKLTGVLATDPTEASASFTNVSTQSWSKAALDLFGLGDLERLLPPIVPSSAIAGTVTEQAAQQTGLLAGTPVVAGAHDVDAAALGIGAIKPGMLSIIMGTFSINQVIGDTPVVDARWQARNFMNPGQWMHMSTSPSSASNFEWAIRRFAGHGPALDYQQEVDAAGLQNPAAFADSPIFLPYLYGAPAHYGSSGGVLAGLRGSHQRRDIVRAVLEGVVYNHLWHVNALRDKMDLGKVARFCGGGANSRQWSQFTADALGLRLEVTDAAEAGARGAAALAGIGIGWYGSMADAVAATVRVRCSFEPEAGMQEIIAQRYARFETLMGLSVQL